MCDQFKEQQEYSKFIIELAEKSKDLLDKYQNLSFDNQRRISGLCKKILATQSILELRKFLGDPLHY